MSDEADIEVAPGVFRAPSLEARLDRLAELDAREAAGECLHLKTTPAFDKQAAAGLDVREIRARWPRFHGNCPDCGEHMICYASAEHYIMGDW